MTPEQYEESAQAAYARDLTAMVAFQFDEEISLIRDPETGQEIAQKLNGEDFDEEETYAIAFYEQGWIACLASLQELGQRIIDSGQSPRYYGVMTAKPNKGELSDESGTDS